MTSTPRKCDVAIVGAGPAGSSTAIRLTLAGLDVVVLEQKAFPRHKLCGEFVSPECMPHFTELGVMEDIASAGGTELRKTVFYSRSGKSVSIDSSWFGVAGALAIGLSRAEMDARLLGRARDVGVDVRERTTAINGIVDNGKVKGIIARDAAGREYSVEAMITIDATGRTRTLTRHFAPDKIKKPASSVAFKAYLRGARLAPAACEIYVYSGGYGGCNQVEGDVFNLCFIVSAELTKRLGSDPERIMREVVCTNHRAAFALRDAQVVSEWFAVPITRFGRGELAPADGLLAVGDAAAFIDPFTGSGMLLALESGKIAAEAIASQNSNGFDLKAIGKEYSVRYGAAFDQRLRLCSALRHVSDIPFAAESLITLLGLSRGFRRRLARATRS